MECRFRLLTEYLWHIASWNGTASPSSAKSPEGKLSQWPWLTSDSVKRHYKHVYVKKKATHCDSGSPETTKTTKLATIGVYGVSQGQWPRMTFERSRCNVKGQMCSSADLNHAYSILVSGSKLRGWKHDFFEKSVRGCISYDVIALWPNVAKFILSYGVRCREKVASEGCKM